MNNYVAYTLTQKDELVRKKIWVVIDKDKQPKIGEKGLFLNEGEWVVMAREKHSPQQAIGRVVFSGEIRLSLEEILD
ncbi:hypothetical protein [Zooshikella harenae]|uniref:Uncharacterized protein n=1 Tax=Zooshikella harenae TaxID=2827238 RepID=A0ABS5ZI22_9GAMM|nr:hypothetical protein [Zooshikella harenae]MBU2713724.1 hypothetical protein [Zooshikella harenae]